MAGDRFVTVFRSGSADAEEQTAVLRDMLGKADITAEIASTPDGVFEVRVPPEQKEDARHFIETQQDFISDVDLSHDLDMVAVFSSQEYNAEMVAFQIRSILDAHGIPSVLVSSSAFPNLPFEVRVPKTRFDEARQAIAAAAEAGPSAAEEAERETETGATG